MATAARVALTKMRARLPGASELVYDNYNALTVAFSPTDQTSDIICSITLYPRWVSLFFPRGSDLPDPHRLLRGRGTKVRHIVLDDANTLNEEAVKALITEAVTRSAPPLDGAQERRVIVKLVAKKQRPRRPA